MWPSVAGMLKICTNGSAPLKKMADTPIYGKIKIFFGTKKALRLNVGVHQRRLKGHQVYPNDEINMTLTFLTVWSNLSLSRCGNTGIIMHER